MQETAITLDPGGAHLAVRRFEPEGAVRATLVIGGAMGVRQAYYAPFARWLAQQGFRAITFDYRGCGDSLPDGVPLRRLRADLFDWVEDYASVIDHAHAIGAGAPLYLLGHSLGAQLPGLLRNAGQVDGLVSIAAGSGYWRDNAPRLRRSVLWLWHVAVPVATRVCGYFPGRRLRKVGDLPAGVMLQWRRWCLNPRYSVGAEGDAARRSYGAVRFPVLALSIDDDELMTLRGTRVLVDFYAGAPRAIQRIAPSDVGLRRIGHFGFFRESAAERLWPRALAALDALGTLPAPRVAESTA